MLTQEELEKCENPYGEIEKFAKGLVEEIKDKEYDRGMEDCWEMVKKMCLIPGICTTDLVAIFGLYNADDILSTYSAKEAKEKIDNYIKEKSEFHVGDEVTFCGKRFIVTRVEEDDDKTLYAIGTNGLITCFNKFNQLTKTGRHFDEVKELLKKMKED